MLEGFPPTKTQHLFISVLEEKEVHAKLLQSCPTLCYLTDCGPPGSSVHGILQARTLAWVAMPSARGFLTQGLNPCLFVSSVGRWAPYHLQGFLVPLAWIFFPCCFLTYTVVLYFLLNLLPTFGYHQLL